MDSSFFVLTRSFFVKIVWRLMNVSVHWKRYQSSLSQKWNARRIPPTITTRPIRETQVNVNPVIILQSPHFCVKKRTCYNK